MGVALSRKALKFRDALVGIVAAGDALQVVAYELVEALAERVGTLAGAGDQLLVDREREVHEHIIRVHVLRVNGPCPADEQELASSLRSTLRRAPSGAA